MSKREKIIKVIDALEEDVGNAFNHVNNAINIFTDGGEFQDSLYDLENALEILKKLKKELY